MFHASLGISLVEYAASAWMSIDTPVTRRVKGYTRFVGKYVTSRR